MGISEQTQTIEPSIEKKPVAEESLFATTPPSEQVYFRELPEGAIKDEVVTLEGMEMKVDELDQEYFRELPLGAIPVEELPEWERRNIGEITRIPEDDRPFLEGFKSDLENMANGFVVGKLPEFPYTIEKVKGKIGEITQESKSEMLSRTLNQKMLRDLGIPWEVINENYDELVRDERITGIKPQVPTENEMIMLAMLPMAVLGVATMPITAPLAIASFALIDQIIDLEDFVPPGTAPSVKKMVGLADFIVKGYVVGKGLRMSTRGIPKLVSRYFQSRVEKFKYPKEIELTAKQVRDIFQTQKLTTVEEKGAFRSLGLDAKGIKVTLKKGVSVKIPGERIIEAVDKPGWAKFKKWLGVETEAMSRDPIAKALATKYREVIPIGGPPIKVKAGVPQIGVEGAPRPAIPTEPEKPKDKIGAPEEVKAEVAREAVPEIAGERVSTFTSRQGERVEIIKAPTQKEVEGIKRQFVEEHIGEKEYEGEPALRFMEDKDGNIYAFRSDKSAHPEAKAALARQLGVDASEISPIIEADAVRRLKEIQAIKVPTPTEIPVEAEIAPEIEPAFSAHYEKLRKRFGFEGEGVEFERITNKNEARKAFNFIQRNPQKAMRIAFDLEPASTPMQSIAIKQSMVESLIAAGKRDLARQVATKISTKATEAAQVLNLMKMDIGNEAQILKNITQARVERIGQKLGAKPEVALEQGQKIVKERTKIAAKEVTKSIKTTKTSFQQMDQFIKGIIC